MLTEFIDLIALLCWAAARDRDAPFAAALRSCFLRVTGGDPECPMGRLVLSRVVEDGRVPAGSFKKGFDPKAQAGAPKTVRRRALMRRLFDGLRRDCIARNDQAFYLALEECRRATCESAACPLREPLAVSGR